MKLKLYSILLLGCVIFSNASCAGDETKTENSANKSSSSMETDDIAVVKLDDTKPDALHPSFSENNEDNGKSVKVLMKTSMGDITILLYGETPLHKNNFVKLVNDGFYNDLLFHRIIKGFMIQGGDPESRNASSTAQLGGGGPGYTIPAEIMPSLCHKKYALSAARLGGPQNPLKASSGCQFYIVTGKITPRSQLEQQSIQKNKQMEDQEIGKFLQDPKNKAYADQMQNLQTTYQSCSEEDKPNVEIEFEKLISEIKPLALKDYIPTTYTEEQLKTYETIGGTPFLDNDYTVFGEVIEGKDVVDKIGEVATVPGDRPVEDVKILSMKVIK